MKLMRILLLFTFIFSANICAADLKSCSENDANYIKVLFNSNELNNKNISDAKFKIDPKFICVVKNELMMDGLSFTLYKSGENQNYIFIYNGLDGSGKMYGPFGG
jgi:hypothetical protein